jgi:hypothetical protein
MNFIAFVQEEFGKIRTILAGYTGDQGDFGCDFAVDRNSGVGSGLV